MANDWICDRRHLMSQIPVIENILGVKFFDHKLILRALTHRSFLNEGGNSRQLLRATANLHYERLETLGDAALELAVVGSTYERLPLANEGQLTRVKSAIVSGRALSEVANRLGLIRFVLMARGQRLVCQESIRAKQNLECDTLESVIGAIFLDQGYQAVKSFVDRYIMPSNVTLTEMMDEIDPISKLQEWTQAQNGELPRYELLSETDSAHLRNYRFGVLVGGTLIGTGSGPSKVDAKTNAAINALASIEKNNGVKTV